MITTKDAIRWIGPLILIAIIGAVHISNITRSRLLPFVDGPNHLAEARIYHSLQAGDPILSRYYRAEMGWFKPATLHVIFCGLSENVERLNRAWYIGYILLLPVGMVLLVRRIGGNPWFAPLGLLLLYNFSTIWGFSGFTMAVPVCLLLLLVLMEHFVRPRLLTAVAAAAGFVLLFYMHVLALLFMGAVVGAACLLVGPRTWRNWLWRGAPLLPALSLLAGWQAGSAEVPGSQSDFQYMRQYYVHSYGIGIADRFADAFWRENSGIGYGGIGRTLGLFLCSVIWLPVLAAACLWRDRIRALWRDTNGRMLLLFAATAALCYVLLPEHMPAQPFLSYRYAVFAYLGLAAALSVVVPPRLARLAPAGVMVACLVHAMLWHSYFVRFNAENAGFTPEFLRAGAGKPARVAALMDEARYRGQPLYFHFQNYALIWNRDIVATKVIDYRFGCIRRGPEGKAIPEYDEFMRDDTDWARLFRRYGDMDCLITHGERAQREAAARPELKLVRQSGPWALFENTAHRAAPETTLP